MRTIGSRRIRDHSPFQHSAPPEREDMALDIDSSNRQRANDRALRSHNESHDDVPQITSAAERIADAKREQ